MLRMVGRPPSGSRSTRGFPPLTKPVAGLRPFGSRSLTLGEGGRSPSLPSKPPRGSAGPSHGSPNFAERNARFTRSFSLSSARRNRLPQRGGPADASPCGLAPLSPPARRLAGGMARPPAKPTSRSVPMKAPAPGSIRLGNKRAGAPGKPGPGEIAVDIDRKNRVLGNPFVLHNPSDAAARNDVIERFRAKYEADLKCDGPMSAATEALAERVRKGERLVCMCWCWPKRCHGAIIIDEIKRRLE